MGDGAGSGDASDARATNDAGANVATRMATRAGNATMCFLTDLSLRPQHTRGAT